MTTFETSYGYFDSEDGPLEWAKCKGMDIDPCKLSFEIKGESFPQYARYVKRQVFYEGKATPYYVMCSRDSIQVVGIELPYVDYQHEEYFLGESLCLLSKSDDLLERLVDYMTCDVAIEEEKTSIGLRYYVRFPAMYESASFKLPIMYLKALQSGDYSGLLPSDIEKLDAFEARVVARYPSFSHWILPGTFHPSDTYMEVTAMYEVKTRKKATQGA